SRESGNPTAAWTPAFAGVTMMGHSHRHSALAELGSADLSVVARVLRRFSDAATIAVLLVIGSGVFNAWLLVGNPSALISTVYGRTLLVKLVFVGAMVALALLNRFFLLPALALRRDVAISRLERNVIIEIVLGAIVLAVASV